MLTNTFYRNSATQKTREAQREATKASEGLERILELANRDEPVGSDKSVQAIDYAVTKLGILKSRIAQCGQLRQVIEELEKVAREKMDHNRQRVDDVAAQLRQVNAQVDGLLQQREVLSAQILAAQALRVDDLHVEDDKVADASDSTPCADGDIIPSNRVVISDYCKGDWDDNVDDDLAKE